MSREARFESVVCRAKSALAGADMKAERLGRVAQRKLLELDEDEYLTLLLRQGPKDGVDQEPRFMALGLLVRRLSARLNAGRLRETLNPSSVPLFRATVVFGDAEHDAIDPGLERRTALELGPAAMDDDEDVLHGVFELRFGHPQAPQTAPHSCEMLGVDRAQRSDETGFGQRARLGGTVDTDRESHDAVE